MGYMRSYTARHLNIQPFIVLIVFIISALSAGCSQVSMQMGSDDVTTPTLLTGSIASTSDEAYADIDQDDRALIANGFNDLTEDLSNKSDLTGLTLHWENRHSGNTGTISDIRTADYANTGCVDFRTTANTIAGLKLYAGTACRDITQKFAVTVLTVADA